MCGGGECQAATKQHNKTGQGRNGGLLLCGNSVVPDDHANKKRPLFRSKIFCAHNLIRFADPPQGRLGSESVSVIVRTSTCLGVHESSWSNYWLCRFYWFRFAE